MRDGSIADGVAPVLAASFPTLVYAAALIGAGSEVLGYDTARSTDHDWGPRLQLFLSPRKVTSSAQTSQGCCPISPKTILGYPTHLIAAGNGTTRHMKATDGPVAHGVEITDLDAWFAANLGFDPRGAIETLDWLAAPTQVLGSVTAGAVFHDGIGELTRVRDQLAWYPDDVWRYVLACQWQRIAEEEPFVGRCGEVGDELGSAVVAAPSSATSCGCNSFSIGTTRPTANGSAAPSPASQTRPVSFLNFRTPCLRSAGPNANKR